MTGCKNCLEPVDGHGILCPQSWKFQQKSGFFVYSPWIVHGIFTYLDVHPSVSLSLLSLLIVSPKEDGKKNNIKTSQSVLLFSVPSAFWWGKEIGIIIKMVTCDLIQHPVLFLSIIIRVSWELAICESDVTLV